MYVGFSVFFLMEVFLFFSLRPSQIREAFTYGSEEEMIERERESKKMGGVGKRARGRKKGCSGKKKGREGGGMRISEAEAGKKKEGGGGSREKKDKGGLLRTLLGIMLTGIRVCNT